MAAKKRGGDSGKRRTALTAFIVALIAVMVALGGYVAKWYLDRGRILSEGDRYAELYGGRDAAPGATEVPAAPSPTAALTAPPTRKPTPVPTPTASAAPTAEPTRRPARAPTQTPTAEPTALATQAPTATPTPAPTAEPTQTPTPAPTPTPTLTPLPLGADMPIVSDEPIPTPDADTLVIALPTAPPVQSGFDALLAVNPETVGFLDIEGMLSLPVVQRESDNDYYLTHSFEGVEAREGTLFMDAMNRLSPEDDCLIVYGHNMKNDTMFGRLDLYGDVDYLKQHPIVHFDTIYENRSYVIFAAFTASMESGNSRYFDVRKFIFDDVEFDKFVLKLQSRSRYAVPVDVRYGDRLLLLVTCDYTNREGRFILALRQVREDETEPELWATAMQARAK